MEEIIKLAEKGNFQVRHFETWQEYMEDSAKRLFQNGNVTDEVLEEYANPDSEKYECMVEEIRKELNFTSLKFNRLDDMLDSVGIDKCKLCTYCWDGKE